MKTNIIILPLLFFITSTIMPQSNLKVPDSAKNVCPLKIGATIPNAIVHDLDGKEVSLRDITAEKKTVIIFYRGGWCPYCNLQMGELQSIEDDLTKLGYKLIALSMDKPEKLMTSVQKHDVKYELFSDSKANACTSFGIAFRAADEYVNKLKGYDMDIEADSGQKHHILPVPAVFLVDTEGTIKFEYVNPDYRERVKAELLLAAARIF